MKAFIYRFIEIIMLGVITLSLSGCPTKVNDPNMQKIDSDTVVIGLLQPLATGSELVREQAARMAVKEINDAGGVNGQRVSLEVLFDANNDPDQGLVSTQALVDDGVVAIIGANSSRVTLPVAMQVTIPAGIALVAHGATSPLISELDDHNTVFRIPPSDALQGRLLAEKVYGEGYHRVALFSQDDPYGEGLRAAFKERYQALGGSLHADVEFAVERASNFSNEITALYASGTPPAVVMFSFAVSGLNLVREIISTKGRVPPLFGVDANLNSAALDNAPTQLVGMRGTTPGASLTRPQYLDFVAAFKTATELDVSNPNDGNAYDAVYLIALAMAQAGSNTRNAVIAHLQEVSRPDSATPVMVGPGHFADALSAIASGLDVDYQGVSSNIDLDERGDPTTATYQYLEVQPSGNGLALHVLETIDYP